MLVNEQLSLFIIALPLKLGKIERNIFVYNRRYTVMRSIEPCYLASDAIYILYHNSYT